MLKMSKSFVVRMVIWSALVVYILCDFMIFSGPLKREVRRIFPTDADKMREAVAQGICAKVFSEPIYTGQVERRVLENLWRSGRKVEEISPEEMKLLRTVALDELIVEHILRVKVRVNRNDVPVSDEEIDAEVKRFETRFDSPEELDKALAAQGIESRKELRYRLAARIQQEKYVSSKIEDGIKVSDEDVRKWYDENREELKMPERRRVRHIFLAALDHPSDEAKVALEGHLKAILEKKSDFAKVAAEVSDDERSKTMGGDLGWMRRDRIPGDFATAVFALKPNHPQLIRTKLGWHIVELTGVKQPSVPSYDVVKEEIAAALSDDRREQAIKQYRQQLKSRNRKKVVIYKMALENAE